MSYESLLTSTVTRWSGKSNDGSGDLSYASKAEILCRWENENKIYNDSYGSEFVSSAVIYSKEQLLQDDWLYLGSSVATDPQSVNGAHRIVLVDTTQSPDGSIVVFKAVLGSGNGDR